MSSPASSSSSSSVAAVPSQSGQANQSGQADFKNLLSLITRSDNTRYIFLIDISGSTAGNVFTNECGNVLLYCALHNIEEAYFLFWNTSVIVFPQLMKLTNFIAYANAVIRPKIGSSTATPIAFSSIPKEWFDHVTPFVIRLVTDGEMNSGLDVQLATEIKKITSTYNNVRIEICAIEARNRDFSVVERNVAGCDVFMAIQTHELTDKIQQFITYAPNYPDGFVNFENHKCPVGYYPYGNKAFSFDKADDFYKYIRAEIQKKNSKIPVDMEALFSMLNELSKTLAAMTKGKPKFYTENLVNRYIHLFEGKIDTVMAGIILSDAIEMNNAGKAQMVAQFQQSLKDLFKMADQSMARNVRTAIGVSENVVTSFLLTIAGVLTLVSCPARLMTYAFGKYANGAVKIKDTIVPVLPLAMNRTDMSEQCMRQWLRQIVSTQFGYNVQSSDCIWVVLSYMLLVRLSNVDQSIKDAFVNFGSCMLRKKRPNMVNVTELQYLQEDNNIFSDPDFDRNMQVVKNTMKLNFKNGTLLYAIFLALGDEQVINKQYIHCKKDMDVDFPDCKATDLLNKFAPVYIATLRIADEFDLDYTCPLTLEDTSAVGGHVINPHIHEASGMTCYPKQVISQSGYDAFIQNPHNPMTCYICHRPITVADFKAVGPLPELNCDIPASAVKLAVNNASASSAVPASSSSAASASSSVAAAYSVSKNFLFWMRGTVGAGKSTTRVKLVEKLKALYGNDSVYVVNTDQFAKTGMNGKIFGKIITSDLTQFVNSNSPVKVVIVDICNERMNASNVFNVNLKSWNQYVCYPNLHKAPNALTDDEFYNYLCWSLHNVLSRDVSTKDTLFWLNPVGAGLKTCITVHATKYKTIFSNKLVKPLFDHEPVDKNDALQMLKAGYDAYSAYLATINDDAYIMGLLQSAKIV